MNKITLYILFIVVCLYACTGYEKILKSTDNDLKYKKAFEYYDAEQYTKASALFDQIAIAYRGTKQSDSIVYFQAMSYFKQNDYILAEHYFKLFSDYYANSIFVEDATFYRAYCLYMQSPRPELDQSISMQCLEALQLFLIKFPETKRKEECLGYIDELREKLVEKSFISAKLYYDLEDYKASIIALNNSLNEYPESKYREEIMFLILKSNYLYAANSIKSKQKERFQATVDEYYSFVTEFPDSKYKEQAGKIYKEASVYVSSNNSSVDIN